MQSFHLINVAFHFYVSIQPNPQNFDTVSSLVFNSYILKIEQQNRYSPVSILGKKPW